MTLKRHDYDDRHAPTIDSLDPDDMLASIGPAAAIAEIDPLRMLIGSLPSLRGLPMAAEASIVAGLYRLSKHGHERERHAAAEGLRHLVDEIVGR